MWWGQVSACYSEEGKSPSFLMAFWADPSEKVQTPLHLMFWDVTVCFFLSLLYSRLSLHYKVERKSGMLENSFMASPLTVTLWDRTQLSFPAC